MKWVRFSMLVSGDWAVTLSDLEPQILLVVPSRCLSLSSSTITSGVKKFLVTSATVIFVQARGAKVKKIRTDVNIY